MGQIKKTIYECNCRLLTFKISTTLLKMPQIVSLARPAYCSAPQNDRLILSLVEDIHVIGKKMARNCRKTTICHS